jgi:hypothetical protein
MYFYNSLNIHFLFASGDIVDAKQPKWNYLLNKPAIPSSLCISRWQVQGTCEDILCLWHIPLDSPFVIVSPHR